MSVDVRVFKTIIGEEIIATVEKYEGGVYILSQPLGVGVDHREGKLVFVPYMPYTAAAEEIHLFESSLLFAPVAPVDSIYDDYIAATRKIVTPGRGGSKILKPV
jgi:hypothetical protein